VNFEGLSIFTPITIATALAITAGCSSDRSATERQRQAEIDRKVAQLQRSARWEETPISLPQEQTPVAQGKTPLVHLFDVGGPVAVMDMTTKSRLVQAEVPNGTIVRVDDRHGVTIGKQRIYPGPLAEGHEYGIFALPATPGVMRQGVGAPGDVPQQ
jgi:hypothetical protein